VQLGISHGYFQGVFPSQIILSSKNFRGVKHYDMCFIYVMLGCLCINLSLKLAWVGMLLVMVRQLAILMVGQLPTHLAMPLT